MRIQSGTPKHPVNPPQFESLLDETELHVILGVNPQQPANDLLLVVKELAQFGVAAQTQAKQLFASRTFGSWMASTTILVHGDFDMTGPYDEQIIVLYYFCGLHASRHNWNGRSNSKHPRKEERPCISVVPEHY